jgi:hypothetical protein
MSQTPPELISAAESRLERAALLLADESDPAGRERAGLEIDLARELREVAVVKMALQGRQQGYGWGS